MKESILYKIVRPIIHFASFCIFRIEIKGKENIKGDKVLLAGIHTSNLDCVPLIASTKRPIHFLAKIELFKGLKGIIFRNLGLIPVDRSKKNPDAVNKAEEYLNNNMVVCLFPEGTTEKGRGLLEFKPGAVKIANDLNIDIVPFVITGKYKLFKRSVVLEFLEPVKMSGDIDKDNKLLRDIIKKKIGD